jgi:ubiquinone/menaquinone biosynthesis C-methylase UbiE
VATVSESRLNAAAEAIRGVGELLVERTGVEPGMDVLDVGTGTGNAALPAGKEGARVTGLDRAPELLEIARERAADYMLEPEWVEGRLERLPFADSSFDRVLSVFGHMFAPRQEAVAAELKRVCRPGGALGLCAWTPDGLGGRMLEALARHVPPPAGYSAPPASWGDERRVRELLGEAVEAERRSVSFTAQSPETWFEFVAESVTPFVDARGSVDDERWSALREELVELFSQANCDGEGGCRLEQEYLLAVVAR